MESTAVLFKPVSHDGMVCEVRSPHGRLLRLSGTLATMEPEAEGDEAMLANPALIHNAWAYAKHEKHYRKLKNEEKRTSHRKQADAHAETAEKIAALIDLVGSTTRNGWCSACYVRTDHRKVTKTPTAVPVYLCVTCGSPTLKCAAPACGNMATRGFGPVRIPRFCAEHRHEVTNFERASDKVPSLDEYEKLRVFDRRNLARGSRLALTGVLAAGIVGTGGLMAAPAVGGAVGTLIGGYTGAAASSYGLALLGGGALSAGGLGMVGGTYVVAAAGAALGSALGASITNAYISEDRSFKIEKFRDGDDIPVIIARGFMTEVDQNWRYAVEAVERRYPNSPIYRLHWGSKELGTLLALGIKKVGAKQAMEVAAGFAARAGRTAAKKLGPITPALLLADAAKNPWHTAMVRADKTGAALAGILARTKTDSFILVGHSLGGRAMITAAETLGTSRDAPRIDTVHLLGAAEGKKGDWRPLSDAVTGTVYNYFSVNDPVLKFAYTAAQAGSVAVGLRGFTTRFANIKDRDVSAKVKGHSDYFREVRLA